ncbi:glycosyltransferase family 2 protein [Chroogloeocystis siderophila]|uniref:Glucosyl transferase n=1 Tax=Chroogloeocystis siderophila 5.2 s.c.1 TaxID=247279 RepID=A0A1U7HVQ4_9CHRO|nr:glycosyltransferase [Chroogloeocystis siderophila]OKH27674.1 glucosyl transferase [Chroogloeocystis siderophila 5.2 s.c.1]
MNEANFQPLVSVIINNYNYGRFLSEAIDSVLNQTYPDIEIIVVDDGSTDNSPEVIARYQDKVIPVLKQNGGQASAFNAGFKATHGEIICMLDADDVFVPEKVTEIVNIFNQYPDIGWCFHRLRFVDAKTGEYIRLSRESGTRKCDFRAQLQNNGRLPFYAPATSGLCFGRSLLQQILPMPEVIRITSDNYLKIAAAALSSGFFLDEQLAFLRLHGGNNYTDKPNKLHLVSKVAILTADNLYSKWPFLAKYTNKLFSRGLGLFWRIGGLETEIQQVVNKYISNVSLKEKININARAIYHFIKAY